MAVGQKRDSRAAGAVSPVVRGGVGQPGAASVDGLLARVADGDAEAFAGVYDQVADEVHGLVRRIVGDQSRAEQVTAEALVEVWRSASRFSPAQGSGTDWVIAIARRRAISHAGAAGNGRSPGLRPSGAAGAVAERAEGSLLAHRCLASMPGPRREAVLLAYCGFTWRQVADLAGVPAERLREGSPGASRRNAPPSALSPWPPANAPGTRQTPAR